MRPLLLDRTGRGPVLAERPTLPPSRVLRPGGRPVGSRYRVHDRIGSGATGTVWRGERTDDGTPVAVKLLRTELAEDPDVVTRFVRERSTLVALEHPHLVGVLDLVAEGELLAIVMPLVEGVDLRHHLRGDAGGPRLSRRAAVGLLADVADALAVVHAAGVVHRDVKPENVLVGGTTARPIGMLTDFGIASATRDSRLTRSSRFVGTPVYLAPERALGRTSGAPADVYALAVTAYEVLAGHPPFTAADDLAVLRAQVDEHPRRPDGWDDAVWDVVSAALAKLPADRPDAGELALGLRAVADRVGAGAVQRVEAPALAPVAETRPVAAEQVPADDDAASTRMGRVLPAAAEPEPEPRRRRRWPWVVAAVVVLVLAVSGGVLFRYLTTPEPTGTATAPPGFTSVPVQIGVSQVGTTLEVAFIDVPAGTAGLTLLNVTDEGRDQVGPTFEGDAPSATIDRPPGEICLQALAAVPTDQAPADLPDIGTDCFPIEETTP